MAPNMCPEFKCPECHPLRFFTNSFKCPGLGVEPETLRCGGGCSARVTPARAPLATLLSSFDIRPTGMASSLCHFPPVGPRADDLTSLCLSFLISRGRQCKSPCCCSDYTGAFRKTWERLIGAGYSRPLHVCNSDSSLCAQQAEGSQGLLY